MLSEDDVRGSVVRGREIVLISEEEPVADEPISFATCRLWQFGLSKMMLCFFSAPSSAVRPFRVDTLLCFALWLPQEEDNTTWPRRGGRGLGTLLVLEDEAAADDVDDVDDDDDDDDDADYVIVTRIVKNPSASLSVDNQVRLTVINDQDFCVVTQHQHRESNYHIVSILIYSIIDR